MKRLRNGLGWMLAAVGLVALGGLASLPAGAVSIPLSDFSSDRTPAEALAATVDFQVSGSTLTVVVTNRTDTTGLGRYRINEIYFNATSHVTDLVLVSPMSVLEHRGHHRWSHSRRSKHHGEKHRRGKKHRDDDDDDDDDGHEHDDDCEDDDHDRDDHDRDDDDRDDDDWSKDDRNKGSWALERDAVGAEEFGVFDFALIGGKGEIDAGDSQTFVFTILGDGPFDAADFTSEVSTTPPGELPSLVSARFVEGHKHGRGCKHDGTYGASVPEPALSVLMAGGLLAAGRRLRSRMHR